MNEPIITDLTIEMLPDSYENDGKIYTTCQYACTINGITRVVIRTNRSSEEELIECRRHPTAEEFVYRIKKDYLEKLKNKEL